MKDSNTGRDGWQWKLMVAIPKKQEYLFFTQMKVILQVLAQVEISGDYCGKECPWLENAGICSLFKRMLSSCGNNTSWWRTGHCRETETRVIQKEA